VRVAHKGSQKGSTKTPRQYGETGRREGFVIAAVAVCDLQGSRA
jgi:hypothetical protein